jgi:hypothetical protein
MAFAGNPPWSCGSGKKRKRCCPAVIFLTHHSYARSSSKGKRVVIKAVGWKEHNRLLIRGEEFQL